MYLQLSNITTVLLNMFFSLIQMISVINLLEVFLTNGTTIKKKKVGMVLVLHFIKINRDGASNAKTF